MVTIQCKEQYLPNGVRIHYGGKIYDLRSGTGEVVQLKVTPEIAAALSRYVEIVTVAKTTKKAPVVE